jgi:hypothetical protein
MIIDSKLPGFKSYFSENRLQNDSVKTSINHTAVAPSEQNNVDLELTDSTKNPQDSYKEKKKKQEHSQKDKKEDQPARKFQTEAEAKSRNLKLLNLI